jgi:hypothetical protein
MSAFAWRDRIKPRKTLIRIAGHQGRDLNPGPPEYEAGVSTTRPRRSVVFNLIVTSNEVFTVTRPQSSSIENKNIIFILAFYEFLCIVKVYSTGTPNPKPFRIRVTELYIN